MAVSVEGVFRILDKASGPLEKIEGQAVKTTLALEAMGKKLDAVSGSKHTAQLNDTAKGLEKIDKAASGQTRSVDAARASTEGHTRAGARAEGQAKATGRAMEGAGRSAEKAGRQHKEASKEVQELAASMRSLASGSGGGGDALRVAGAAAGDAGKAFGALGGMVALLQFPAMATAAGVAAQAIGALGGGVVALLPLLAQAGGAIAALPGIMTAAAGGLAAGALAFHGLSAAIGAGFKAQTTATQDGIAYADSYRQQTHAVAEAQFGLVQAHRGVATAEYGLQQAQHSSQLAQQSLTLARRDAVRNLIDMRLAAQDALLGEKGAEIAYQRAQRNLATGTFTGNNADLDQQSAVLDVERARLGVTQARVGAHRAVADATRSNHGDSAAQRSVTAAMYGVKDAAHAVAEAQNGVVTAMHGEAAAANGLMEAQIALAHTQANGTAGAHAYALAMKELSPAARSFAREVVALRPEIKNLSAVAGERLFPYLERDVGRVRSLLPTLKPIIRGIGGEIGKGIDGVVRSVTDHPGDVKVIGRMDVALIHDGFEALTHFANAFRKFTVAAEPFTRWLSRVFVDFSKHVDDAAGNTTKIQRGLERTKDALKLLGGITSNVWTAFKLILRDAEPLGKRLWGGMLTGTQNWVDYLSTHGSQVQTWFDKLYGPLHAMGKLAGSLAVAFAHIAVSPGLEGTINALAPAVPALESLLTGLAANGPALGGLLTSVAELAAALPVEPLGLAFRALDKIVQALTWITKHVPAAGAAFSLLIGAGLLAKLTGVVKQMETIKALSVVIGGTGKGGGGLKGALQSGLGGGGNPGASALAKPQAVYVTNWPAGFGPRAPLGGGAPEGTPGGPGGGGGDRGAYTRRGRYAAERMNGVGRFAALRTAATGLGPRGLATAARAAGIGGIARGAFSAGRVALRGAGKIALPLMAVSAGLDFLTARGNLKERGQSALNAGTFGLSGLLGLGRGRKSKDANVAAGQTSTEDFLKGASGAGAIAGQARHLENLLSGSKTERQQVGERSGGVGRNGMVQRIPVYADVKVPKLSGDVRERVKAELAALAPVAKAAGSEMGRSLSEALGVRLDGGQGPKRSLRAFRRDFTGEFRGASTDARFAMSKQIAGMADDMSHGSKKQQAIGRGMARAVEAQYDHMGQTVRVVNGNILSGSTSEWSRIGAAIRDPAERARQEVHKNFTAMQQEAAGSLEAMGFSKSDARNIIKGMEKGSAAARLDASSGPTGAGQRQSVSDAGRPGVHARGGRITGTGLEDTVTVAPGHLAAPGELIVNRHTERRVAEKYGVNLGAEVAGETRKHSAYARGGRVGGFGGGQVQNARAIIGVGRGMHAPYKALLAAIETGIVESSLTNISGGDRDSAGVFQQRPSQGWGSLSQVTNVAHAAASFFRRAIPLAGGQGSAGVLAQSVQRSAFPGRYDQHRGEAMALLHALGGGGGAGVAAALGGGGGGRLRIPRSKLRGAPGGLSNMLTGLVGAGLQKRVDDAAASAPNAADGGVAGGGDGMPATAGPEGTTSFKGVLMARWVANALRYAQTKGVDSQPTSGYRSHAHNVAQGRLYHSEHEYTQYPHGAVDFGGFHDGLERKMAVVNATADYKYPLLAPKGFTDDGHASGTGHAMGGRIPWYGKGADFMARKPQVIGVGDRPERVSITPVSGPGSTKGAPTATAQGANIKVEIGHIVNHEPGDIRKILRRELEDLIDELETVGADE